MTGLSRRGLLLGGAAAGIGAVPSGCISGSGRTAAAAAVAAAAR